ncbi:MAG TPA: hypothetical protein VIZ66_07515 [Sphingomicrobium sp.]
MAFNKPFHRNVRGLKKGPNSGFSSWAYIVDREYAKDAEHYVRAFLMIQDDLKALFEYIEPSDECRSAFSYRIHALFMRACIEMEANFKAIFEENLFKPKGRLTMADYRKIDATHHLSSYEVLLPTWSPYPTVFKPFEAWKQQQGLPWYAAYNDSKHDRHEQFKKANLENLVGAVAGLLAVISSQFRSEDFSAGSTMLSTGDGNFYPMESAMGSLFRIKYPEDWSEDEIYDFNWSELQKESDRYAKIDYNQIP